MPAWRPCDRAPRPPDWATSGPCRRSWTGGRLSRPPPPGSLRQARPAGSPPLAETIHKIVKNMSTTLIPTKKLLAINQLKHTTIKL